MAERRVPFVNIARLRGVEKQLDRIATALENLLRYAYGYNTAKPTAQPSSSEPSDVLYTDDFDQAVQELEHVYRGEAQLVDNAGDEEETE